MNNIMLDLETLDTQSSAVVLSLGAVAFDPNGDTLNGAPALYVEANDLRVQQQLKRTISADTVSWWMQQDVLAKRIFSESPPPDISRLPTREMLQSFAGFVHENGAEEALVWGNGSDFDNIILGTLYDAYGLKKPWSYSRNRCFRTMKALAPDVKVVRHGVHHNALDDAISQADHLQRIMRSIFDVRPGA